MRFAGSTPLFATCLLALTALPAFADDADSQFWFQFNFNKRLKNGVRLFAEAQPRVGENWGHGTQLLLRPAIGYQVNRSMSLWLGYGWTPSLYPDFNHEHRIFQQLLFENRYTRTDVINRTRFEQRRIHGTGGTSLRLRHMARASHPLDSRNRWAVAASNELFWHLNSISGGPQSGFDQNRAYTGISHAIAPHTRAELGYMASFVNPPGNRPNRRLDIMMLTLNYTL